METKYYQENLFGTKNDLFRIEHFYEFSKKFRTLIDSKRVKNVINKLAGKKSILFKEKINRKRLFSILLVIVSILFIIVVSFKKPNFYKNEQYY